MMDNSGAYKQIAKQIEMRGMSRQELVDFFVEMGGVSVQDSLIIGEDAEGHKWSVELSEQKQIQLCSLLLPATSLTIKADSNLLNHLLMELRMKFLSAGG
ncbi:hypothetical protein [Desulfuribacillus alkaliarsenatis]|uniref:Molybdopterin cofactor biosynthesis MoaD-related C-terminal domain-containing protein n=1 Tax=Desulfuribacillus alkaliarsenatis TaxID=766136 RepID=A0A1E5FYR3_9FIRM|nr:hypothetical protein [Desulfuribacillus alkaliarsenatis]OEF95709.1 hypothetical protein BHF68_11420 [Desulfuribacillus alkaliarsenatis]